MKTILKNGDISEYGFRCGYNQTFETLNLRVKIEMTHGSYDVKVYDFDNHKNLYWGVTNKLIIARTAYNFIKHRMESIINSLKGSTKDDFLSYCETYPQLN